MKNDLYSLNDNELLYMIRTGDPMAHQMLLDKYENYMRALMERFVSGVDRETYNDLTQECKILLAELCMKYREDQDCRFLTYLVNAIRNRLNALQRVEKRRMKNIRLISLDECVKEEGIDGSLIDFIDPKTAFYQPEFEWRYAESVDQLKQMLDTLTQTEKRVWQMMNDDLTYEEAAEQMGISKKQFDNMRLRLKKKIVFCITKPDYLKQQH